MIHHRLTACVVLALIGLTSLGAGSAHAATTMERRPGAAAVRRAMGLHRAEIVRVTTLTSALDTEASTATSLRVAFPVRGETCTLELEPYSVRAPGYAVYELDDEGVLHLRPTSPVNTYRGRMAERPDVVVTGAMIGDRLHATIMRPEGRLFLEPARTTTDGVPSSFYVVYAESDVRDQDGHCDGAQAPAAPISLAAPSPAAAGAGAEPDRAELACDADFEYFTEWGANTEARINAVINQVNQQYETEVDLTHLISAIVIRTAPQYTATNPQDLVNQLRNSWIGQHLEISRDLVHLFTGKDLDGTVIGVAHTTGSVCTTEAFCLAQSDFSTSFASSTDLTAHELGHLWGASHCTCPSSTMNATVTSTNTFSTGSPAVINSFKGTASCLNVEPVPAYCTARSNSASAESIRRVTYGAIDSTSFGSFYSDFTNLSTNVLPGTSASLSIELQGFNSDIGAVWIDWNGDVDFEDAGEQVATLDGAGPFTVVVNAPIDAIPGMTRMRIRIQDGFSDPNVEPCGNTDFGEVEDYGVLIESPEITAACCIEGACLEMTESACTVAGGTFTGAGVACSASPCVLPCPTDLDGNGDVGFLDLTRILSTWGLCGACPEDLDGDGRVGFLDLMLVLSSWGPCP